ncbi:MAG: NAD-dependent epimerase/dehydratase family protein, partial [Proteobacteria bacterium]|nr:NAD-dependent epimerase/dehydratase family protein [Pseudomonadota bacterium]
MIVAVTGAGGFIGSILVPALSDAGYSARPLVRIGKGRESGRRDAGEIDVATGEGLDKGFEGADAVVHLAARNQPFRERSKGILSEYRKVNVEGTRNVIRAAASSGVKTIIHMSSIKAMGEGSDGILEESGKCDPETPYGISKLESEEVVLSETKGTGMRGIILRLPMAYGPGNKGNIFRMLRWADRGYPFPIFPPDNLRSMIYVGNVAAGVMAVLKSPPVAGAPCSTYILKDSVDYSTRMIYTVMCRAFGKSPRFLPLPKSLARLGSLVSEDFRKTTTSFRVGSEKISRELGFTPPFDI